MNIEKELQELIDKHHSGEIDSRDEWYREVVDLKERVKESKFLTCVGKCDHGYNDEHGNDLFCGIKK